VIYVKDKYIYEVTWLFDAGNVINYEVSFFLVAMGDRGDFFFLFGQIFFGWDGRLRQSFSLDEWIQESFYPGRTVFSRKLFFFFFFS